MNRLPAGLSGLARFALGLGLLAASAASPAKAPYHILYTAQSEGAYGPCG